MEAWARRFVGEKGKPRTLAVMEAMTHAIKAEFRYEARHEEGTQAASETIARGSGTCRDFAVLMMEALRSFGVAARFVTGYLYDDTSGTTRGGGSTHAWCNAYLPGAGWMEYDPTNGLIAGSNLVRVGVARSAAQALPVSGGYVGGPDDSIGLKRGRRRPRRADLTRRRLGTGERGVSSDRSGRRIGRSALCLDRTSAVAGRRAGEWCRKRMSASRRTATARTPTSILRWPRFSPDLFGLCVVGVNGAAYASGEFDHLVLDHERVEAVRVRARLRGSGPGGRAPARRRQRDRPAVQLARSNRAQRRRADQSDGQSGRDRHDQPRPRLDGRRTMAVHRSRACRNSPAETLEINDAVFASASNGNSRNQAIGQIASTVTD